MASGVPRNRASGSGRRPAKRARTQPDAPPLAGDWASLPSGPAGLVAERVLAGDVADYARFRAVCTAWRACCADPRAHGALDRRFHPRRWVMLPRAFAARGRRPFLNVATGERVRVRLPDLRRHAVLGPTAEGLVVLCRKGTLVVRLLNPLTGQIADLPPASTLLVDRGPGDGSTDTAVEDYPLLNAGMAGDSTVVLHFAFSILAVAAPGDARWTRLDPRDDGIVSATPCNGRFYCATTRNLKVVDATAGERPRLAPAVAGFHCWDTPMRPYLAEVDGELVMTRPPSWAGLRWECKVYRVSTDAGREKAAAATPRLGGAAVFIGLAGGRAVAVPAGLCGSVSADTVYFCWSDGDGQRPKVDACNFVDGRVETDCRRNLPWSMADYLACYVAEIEDW
ncbi:hypothetical protein ACP4OV_018820 [Aristida adscensionis]